MSNRSVKLLRKFLGRPLTKEDKRIWRGLPAWKRGRIREVVESGRMLSDVAVIGGA
jgi:hypothetical protein